MWTPSCRRTCATRAVARWKSGAKIKQIPCSFRQRSTTSGEAAVLTPSASRTSALPDFEEAARAPCFATGNPAPAMTNAAAVETLNRLAALEPVPAVSMKRSCRECRGVARSRIASAMPASSSTVSPLAVKAMSAAAICVSVATGSSNASRKFAASVRERFSPCTRRIIVSRRSRLPVSLTIACGLIALLSDSPLRAPSSLPGP